MTFKRPMLAAPLLKPNDPHTDQSILEAMKRLRYPVLATIKKDGIRAVRLSLGGRATLLSRTLKEIPNKYVRENSLRIPSGYDMELWNPSLTYDQVESIVMSREHPESWRIQYHILDKVSDAPYHRRMDEIFSYDPENLMDCHFQYPVLLHTPEQLLAYFVMSEQDGHEGICFRLPDSPYKQGRSTPREQYLVKLCRSLYDEATVIGLLEQMSNANEESRNAVGMMDRSSSSCNLVPKNTLGAFVVRDKKGREFKIGTGVGLTDKLRKQIWNNRDSYIGTIVKYKCKPYGEKDLPRSPIFVGFRNPIDL